jgi:hypothetical protein
MSGRRFDLPELVLTAGVAALLGAIAVAQLMFPNGGDPPEEIDTPEYYARRYRAKYSSGPEEWLIRDFFQDRREGVFLDVGAGDYRDGSNTYFLETQLGWSGLAIDAQPAYGRAYVQHRPRTRFVAAFVSDRGDAVVSFFVPPSNKLVASGSDHYVTSRWLRMTCVRFPRPR